MFRRPQFLLLLGAALLGGGLVALQVPVRFTRRPLEPPPAGSTRDALARILQGGVLRVGTTGDYDPFSVGSWGNLRGIDVEAAHRLARALGPDVRVQFVKTSWPTLTADLLAGRFDVAMSGVSWSRHRLDSGLLTRPYLLDAKVALIRTADRRKYQTLADLDRPEVTVLVNPGGTNHQFVRARLRRARVVVIHDNLAIPALVAEGKGDVMFTDGVEARLNARRDPRLSVALTDPPLLKIAKVYYLPRGQTRLLDAVNAWITCTQADGTYDRLWARYVGR